MEQKIIEALNAIQQRIQQQAGLPLPYMSTSLSLVLKEMGYTGDFIPGGFYEALESLELTGVISDQSSANAGFGRTKGVDGEISLSTGAKIILL